MSTLDIAVADGLLAEVAVWWPWLAADLQPGTARRWQQHTDTPEQAARRTARARTERDERDAAAPGETRAPARLDVLDTLVTLELGLLDLADSIQDRLDQAASEQAGRPVAPPRPWRRAPGGQINGYDPVSARGGHTQSGNAALALAAVRVRLGQVEGLDVDLAGTVAQEVQRLSLMVRRSLRLVERAAPLRQPCPVCDLLSLVAYHGIDEAAATPVDAAQPDGTTRRILPMLQVAPQRVVCTANTWGEDPVCECDLERCESRCHQGGRHTWAGEYEMRRLGLVIDETPRQTA